MSDLIKRWWNLLIYAVDYIASILVRRMNSGDKNEQDPLTDDEFILRRIHQSHYKPGKNPPVLRVAFEPKDEDHDGLSFHREYFVAAETLAFCGRKPGEYYIARFSVGLLRGPDYQLTIDPAPTPDPNEPRGHSVIRQLSIDELQLDEAKSKSLQNRLARLASTNIVYIPAA